MKNNGFRDLNERTSEVLYSIVESYIEKADPVGSRFVSRKYGFDFSAATIRNIMADLAEMGYLNQPHTSAGRVPTDLGYRFYVNNLLMRRRQRDEQILRTLKRRFLRIKSDIDDIVVEATNMISTLSHYLGVAVPVNATNTTLNRIQLYRYRQSSVAAVLLTDEGVIRHKVINTHSALEQKDLNRISDYINSQYTGMTMGEIIERLSMQMNDERDVFDMLVTQAVELCREALSFQQTDLYMSGLSEFIGLPDFSERIGGIARAIEDKAAIVSLLEGLAVEKNGVRVVIGSEIPLQGLHGLSIVSAPYTRDGLTLGSIGIIGPTRMDYVSAITLVEAMSGFISETLSQENIHKGVDK